MKKMKNDMTIDLHPRRATRIGPEGLVDLLVSNFETAMNDPALVRSSPIMIETLLHLNDRDAALV